MSGTDKSVKRKILVDLLKERERQVEKWGDQDHTDAWWLVILAEEFGEVARAIFDARYNVDEGERDAELIQVMAVAMAWLENRAQDRERMKKEQNG